MKYLTEFQTIADYQAFKNSSDWVTPNVSIIKENVSGNGSNIIFEKFVNTDDSITFPVYLVEGDNGQLGIDVYNYLQIKYNPNNTWGTTAAISEIIYADNKMCSNIRFGGTSAAANIYLGHTINFNESLELTPYGVIGYFSHGGGSN